MEALKIAILGYKSNLVGEWDPSDTKKGLPGSEECAVYASDELARRGHKVTIYMNPPTNSGWRSNTSNPQWISEDWFHNNENKEMYDLVLMWRRYDQETGRKRSKIVFLWPHDSPRGGFEFPNFDGVCVLTEYHRTQFQNAFPGFNKIPYVICGNGIVPEQFENPMSFTNPYSVGYFSNYARGLFVLLVIWKDIRREFPEATLSICYGRQTWGNISDQSMQNLVNLINICKSEGVTEHGKVGHEELASIMKNTSVWAYPANSLGWAETFCITAVKCQVSGCIPVTTRIGALNETVHPDAPSAPNITDNKSIQDYKEVLLKTLRRIRDSNPEDVIKERQKYINFASKWSWSSCVDKWLELYNKMSI